MSQSNCQLCGTEYINSYRSVCELCSSRKKLPYLSPKINPNFLKDFPEITPINGIDANGKTHSVVPKSSHEFCAIVPKNSDQPINVKRFLVINASIDYLTILDSNTCRYHFHQHGAIVEFVQNQKCLCHVLNGEMVKILSIGHHEINYDS